MIVVDTNVVAYWLIEGEHTESARRALARDAEWVAPSFWRSEFRNTLIRYVRRGDFSLSHALLLQNNAQEFMAGREYGVDSERVLQLAHESGRSAYDCEFVALADHL